MKAAAVGMALVLASAGVVHAEPNGLTVWSGKGLASVRGGDEWRPSHVSAMHFANGRIVYSTMGPGPTYAFGGTPPAQHGRVYAMHVDQVHVGKETFDADGACQVKLRPDHTLRSVGCAASGGPEPSMHFDADRTPPDFQSFDKH